MTKPSNEVLEERICNMEKTNNKEHSEIKEMLIEMSKKIEKLPESFVTRMEFKAASAVL